MQNGSAPRRRRPECANYRALGAKKVSRLLRDNCLFPEHYEAGVTKTLLTGVVLKPIRGQAQRSLKDIPPPRKIFD